MPGRARAAGARLTPAMAEVGESFRSLLAVFRQVSGREAQQRSGISYAQWRLLSILAEHRRMSASELSAAAAVTPATVTKMLDQLASAGVVERARDESDRRVVHTQLTASGRRLLRTRTADYDERFAAALRGLSEEELRQGAKVLERLRRFFETIAE